MLLGKRKSVIKSFLPALPRCLSVLANIHITGNLARLDLVNQQPQQETVQKMIEAGAEKRGNSVASRDCLV